MQRCINLQLEAVCEWNKMNPKMWFEWNSMIQNLCQFVHFSFQLSEIHKQLFKNKETNKYFKIESKLENEV